MTQVCSLWENKQTKHFSTYSSCFRYADSLILFTLLQIIWLISMQWEQGFKRRWSPPLITCFTLWCKVDSHDVKFLLTVFLRLFVLSTRKKQKVRFSTFHVSVPFRYPPTPTPLKNYGFLDFLCHFAIPQ